MLPPIRRPSGIPAVVEDNVAQIGHEVRPGLDHRTWNGLTPDLYEVGEHAGGTRRVHLSLPGVYFPSVQEARARYTWTDTREKLFNRLQEKAAVLREKYGVTHLLAYGSMFTSDWPKPGDIDAIAYVEPSRPLPRALSLFREPPTLDDWNRAEDAALPQGGGIHVYAHDRTFSDDASPIESFSRAPALVRKPLGSNWRNQHEVGGVLFDVAELAEVQQHSPVRYNAQNDPTLVHRDGRVVDTVRPVVVKDADGAPLGLAYPSYQYERVSKGGARFYAPIPGSRTLTFNGRPVDARGFLQDAS